MSEFKTIGDILKAHGVPRRDFLKFCVATASLSGLFSLSLPKIARALENSPRPSVIWLSLQTCTACTESFTRAHAISIESLMFDYISLDYQHTLQVASGDTAERILQDARAAGQYYLVVEGSLPTATGCATTAGRNDAETLVEMAAGAKAIVAVGTCATYGGIAQAAPNPTGAVPIQTFIPNKTLVNLPGCPPIPTVITAVLAYIVIMGELPRLDTEGRPLWLYERKVHEYCNRRPFFEQGLFAETFDDPGAKAGWCLLKLGCKGPSTYNACATAKWNADTSFPIQSGHGCLGCAEAQFWDKGSLYKPG